MSSSTPALVAAVAYARRSELFAITPSFGSPSHAYVPCGQNIETVEKAGSYPGRAPSICCKAAQLQSFASCKDQMVKAAEAREQLPVWWTRSCSCGNEYLAAENRILKAQLKGRLTLSGTERATLGVIGHRLGRKLSASSNAPSSHGSTSARQGN